MIHLLKGSLIMHPLVLNITCPAGNIYSCNANCKKRNKFVYDHTLILKSYLLLKNNKKSLRNDTTRLSNVGLE